MLSLSYYGNILAILLFKDSGGVSAKNAQKLLPAERHRPEIKESVTKCKGKFSICHTDDFQKGRKKKRIKGKSDIKLTYAWIMMNLSEALFIIKRSLEREIRISSHFEEKCHDRGLEPERMLDSISKNRILGILEQNEEEMLYKVWLSFERDKDINIILRILPDCTLKLITIFPCNAYRRRR